MCLFVLRLRNFISFWFVLRWLQGVYWAQSLYKYVFNMQNSTFGVNSACIAANPDNEWKCIIAPFVYPHIKTPLFALQSEYDTCQVCV